MNAHSTAEGPEGPDSPAVAADAERIAAINARITAAGLVAVVRTSSRQSAHDIAVAVHSGGIVGLEITLTTPDANEVISSLRNELGPEALIGAGSVTSLSQAEKSLAAGANFLVSPGHVDGLVAAGHTRGVPVVLGALTPSEALRAHQDGADFIKIFPCSALGGARYLKALRAPLPHLKLMPTGGVDLETLPDYVAAGASVLGIGSALSDERLLGREGASAFTELAQRYVRALQALRA